MKICTKCGIEKPLSEFSKRKEASDGLQYRCKTCFNQQARESRQAHPEREKVYHQKSYQKNKEKHIAKVTEWQKNNPEKVKVIAKRKREKPEAKARMKVYSKEYNKTPQKKKYNKEYMAIKNQDPEYVSKRKKKDREHKLRRNYGLTTSDFEALEKKQDERCAMCHTHKSLLGKRGLHVDHNHETGEVRGLLCGPCNIGLGSLRDDPVILQRGIDYLKKYGSYAKASETISPDSLSPLDTPPPTC